MERVTALLCLKAGGQPTVVKLQQSNPAMTANPNANADGLPNVAPTTLNANHSMAAGNLQPGQQAPANGDGAAAAGTANNTNRQQVLRHQQQHLLLLRHSAKCPHENGKCPVTPHCAGMKRLWKHIVECKDQKCQFPHCISSRHLLSHYHRCKDARCPVCIPVREAINGAGVHVENQPGTSGSLKRKRTDGVEAPLKATEAREKIPKVLWRVILEFV
ncbi:hypothetical protein TrCOL_g6897 [Triparma columacea]|uniref:histone acetyltransferase n=1 Tax=Triparma columacea TaxID=722753 RepID=A0A9W7LGL6_9STRA|nr:hypothetical protein TrCOL_g6897 [Triparma columacea]